MRRFLLPAIAWALCATALWAAKDTPAAAKTRQRLKTKVSVEYKDTRLLDVAKDLQSQLDNKITVKLDNEGGVSNNLTVTFSATDKPLDEILDKMFAKNQLGYIIISDAKDRRDGFIIIKKGKQRGYEEGDAPAKASASKAKPAKNKAAKDDDDDKPATEAKPAKGKKKTKGKPAKGTDKTSRKDKSARETSGDDADQLETKASSKLKLVKMLYQDGVRSKDDDLIKKAKLRLHDLIKDYPKTKAAGEARTLLKKLER